MSLDTGLAIVGIVIALVASVLALPPFLQFVCGRPKIRLSCDDTAEQGSKLLLGLVENRPITSRLLRSVGITRTAAKVVVLFDIREHGTNKILANDFRARLMDRASQVEGLSPLVEPPHPLLFVVAYHSDRGACAKNFAPHEEKVLALTEGEYFVEVKMGFYGGSVARRRSFKIGASKDATCWTSRPAP